MQPGENPQLPNDQDVSLDKCDQPDTRPIRLSRVSLAGQTLASLMIGYLLLAYLMVPAAWRIRAKFRPHPGLSAAPTITHTRAGIPGDPINIALISTDSDLVRALRDARWNPADPLTFKSCVHIASGTIFRRPYPDAPVSNLYVWGRKQDLAFEKPVGADPRRRHHVRFWRADEVDMQGRPIWAGAATYDSKAGVSHTTGQITHHIAPDVDTERETLLGDLERAGWLRRVDWLDEFQKSKTGRNGGGDPYHTDGRLAVGIIGPPEPAKDGVGVQASTR
jgi:hypothetical protein